MTQNSLSLIWLGGLLLQAALATAMGVRKTWRKYPLFTSYLFINLAINVVLYAIRWAHLVPAVYFRAYWITQAIVLLLGLGVVFEIFGLLFAPYPALKKLALVISQWTVLVLVALGVVVIYAQPSGAGDRLMASFLLVEEAARIVQVGLVAFLFLFASVFGLHWRQYAFGIALGVGAYAAMQLVAVALRSYLGASVQNLTRFLTVLDFDVSLLIWLGYMLAPELAASRTEVPHRDQLEQWNKALTELIYQ